MDRTLCTIRLDRILEGYFNPYKPSFLFYGQRQTVQMGTLTHTRIASVCIGHRQTMQMVTLSHICPVFYGT